MTTQEIKFQISLRKSKRGEMMTVTTLAEDIGESRVQVSQAINFAEGRSNTRVRRKIARRLGIPYAEMWGEDLPAPPPAARSRPSAAAAR